MAPSNSNPPSLPPTVEEAYRRKCIQLKQRSKEIEDENDAYRLRLRRLERQIQKARLERAFLLEQIAKRTSTNVEDSDGSPSPPPTPEDKPMRVKRGHKSLLGSELATSGPTFIDDNPRLYSPNGSDTFPRESYPRNGNIPKPPKRPSNGFEIYCNDTRPVLQEKHKDEIANGEYQLEQELAKGWKDLSSDDQATYQKRYEEALKQWKEEREAYRRSVKNAKAGRNGYDDYSHAPSRRGRGSAAAARQRSHLAQQDDEDVSVMEDQGDEQDIEMGDADQAEEDAEQGTYDDPETEDEQGGDNSD